MQKATTQISSLIICLVCKDTQILIMSGISGMHSFPLQHVQLYINKTG
jgi:hypothetical protein